MTQYDKQLEELRQQMAKKTRLENILKNLDVQRQELFDRVSELEQIMEKEQADVDKLNRRSLAAFYYSVMGKKESILDKEQQEAYAARVKYDTALSELNAVDSDIQKSKTELLSIQRSEQQYQEILQKKTAFLKASGNADATEILEFEKQLTALNSELEEIQEAIAAGKCACPLHPGIDSNGGKPGIL